MQSSNSILHVAVQSVLVTLNNAMHLQATNDTKWHIIHEEFKNGSCTNGGIASLYNPYQVQVTSSTGYMNDCNPRRQQRCAMGDLSGKLGTLAIESKSNHHKTYSFYDENLFLTGNYSSEFNMYVYYIYNLGHASTSIGNKIMHDSPDGRFNAL